MEQKSFDEFRQQLHPDLAILSSEQIKVVSDVVREQAEKNAQAAMEVFSKKVAVQVSDSKTGWSYHGCAVSLNTKTATMVVDISKAEQRWQVPPSLLETLKTMETPKARKKVAPLTCIEKAA